jgi:hypothetical protein
MNIDDHSVDDRLSSRLVQLHSADLADSMLRSGAVIPIGSDTIFPFRADGFYFAEDSMLL